MQIWMNKLQIWQEVSIKVVTKQYNVLIPWQFVVINHSRPIIRITNLILGIPMILQPFNKRRLLARTAVIGNPCNFLLVQMNYVVVSCFCR